MKSFITLFSLLAVALSQLVGTNTPEVHPPLPIQQCTAAGCKTLQTSVTLDANWRWLHTVKGTTNCYTGNKWSCGSAAECTANCAVDGARYASTYGVTTTGNAVRINFITKDQYGTNIGSRLYLMANDTEYFMFQLKNKEFSYEVDVSQLPCGLNGALYMVEMDKDGGLSKYPTNKAGARYGTGYCDAQCPHDLKYIAGEANVEGWKPTSANSGNGKYGSCCHEMDIWEGNSISAAYTPHVCTKNGPYRCSGLECGDGADRYKGLCDKDGCDYNSYRNGAKDFYGPGKTVDTTKPFTVVTQFVTADGSDNGPLSEIRRQYVQNGKVIANSATNVTGLKPFKSVSSDFCSSQKKVFGDNDDFTKKGGLKAMGEAVKRGLVLVLSLWDDYDVSMLWLDSTYPPTKSPSAPGVARGTCPTTSGKPADVERDSPNAYVIYSNIRFGSLGSTFGPKYTPPSTTGGSGSTSGSGSSTSGSSTSGSSTSGSTSGGNCGALYSQCGGQNWSGPTCCSSGQCKVINQYYSQCL